MKDDADTIVNTSILILLIAIIIDLMLYRNAATTEFVLVEYLASIDYIYIILLSIIFSLLGNMLFPRMIKKKRKKKGK